VKLPGTVPGSAPRRSVRHRRSRRSGRAGRCASRLQWLDPAHDEEVRDAGGGEGESRQKILVEHTSINPNKAAHIGHVRNAVLGDTFVRVLQAAGERIEVQNYIDNTGVQVADVVVGFRHIENLTLEQIKDELLSSRDLSKKGNRQRQLKYVARTAEKAFQSV